MASIRFLSWAIFLCFLGLTGCTSPDESLRMLGTQEFSKQRWQMATQQERATMIYSFIKTHDVKSMTSKDIFDFLGKSTAYYQYDDFPAYLVGPENVKSEAGSGYLLAFPVSRSTGLVQRYVVQPDPQELSSK